MLDAQPPSRNVTRKEGLQTLRAICSVYHSYPNMDLNYYCRCWLIPRNANLGSFFHFLRWNAAHGPRPGDGHNTIPGISIIKRTTKVGSIVHGTRQKGNPTKIGLRYSLEKVASHGYPNRRSLEPVCRSWTPATIIPFVSRMPQNQTCDLQQVPQDEPSIEIPHTAIFHVQHFLRLCGYLIVSPELEWDLARKLSESSWEN